MNSEIKKIEDKFNGVISDIPLDELRKIYHERSYDAHRIYWFDQDLDGFKEKQDELDAFLDRMDRAQVLNMFTEELKVIIDIAYDLRCWVRTEGLRFLQLMLAHHWILGSIKDDLKTYDATGDKNYFDSAMDYIDAVREVVTEVYNNDESLQLLESHLDNIEYADGLTDEDREVMAFLRDHIRIYRTEQELKDGEKPENI
jgi:hypothetical protein